MTTKFQAITEAVQKSETVFDRIPAVFEAAIEVTNALHRMRTGLSDEKWEKLLEEHSLLEELVDSTIDLEDAVEAIARKEETNA